MSEPLSKPESIFLPTNSPHLLPAFDLRGIALSNRVALAPMTLSDFREVFSGPLIGNCGYDQASAEQAIAEGNADFIAIGRPYISNPDLVEGYANNWPLDPDSDRADW